MAYNVLFTLTPPLSDSESVEELALDLQVADIIRLVLGGSTAPRCSNLHKSFLLQPSWVRKYLHGPDGPPDGLRVVVVVVAGFFCAVISASGLLLSPEDNSESDIEESIAISKSPGFGLRSRANTICTLSAPGINSKRSAGSVSARIRGVIDWPSLLDKAME